MEPDDYISHPLAIIGALKIPPYLLPSGQLGQIEFATVQA